MKYTELSKGDSVYYMHPNHSIYKAIVYKITKSTITLDGGNNSYPRFQDYSIKTGISKLYGANSYLMGDITPREVRNHNRALQRQAGMTGLELYSGELLFEGTKLSELNYTQQGRLEDLIDNMPDAMELEEIDNCRDFISDFKKMFDEISTDKKKWLKHQNSCDGFEKRTLGDAMIAKVQDLLETYDLETY